MDPHVLFSSVFSTHTPFPLSHSRAASSGDVTAQPWYVGHVTRHNAETLLTTNGRQGDFLIRESTNKVRHPDS